MPAEMSRTDPSLPSAVDPDRTDRLPMLDERAIVAVRAEELLETTGTWSVVEVQAVGDADALEGELERRNAAIAELTSMLREKTFALTRAEKELEQARSELVRARQAASRAVEELERRLHAIERERLDPAASHEGQRTAPAARRDLTRLDDGRQVVHLLSAPRTAIGRTPDNDLQLEESYISRSHAVIRLGPESAVIEDAGSRNGVFVNDRRVRRELLQDGDIVTLGKARFRFHAKRPEET